MLAGIDPAAMGVTEGELQVAAVEGTNGFGVTGWGGNGACRWHQYSVEQPHLPLDAGW